MAKIPKSEQKRPKMALKVEPNFASFLTQKPYKEKKEEKDRKKQQKEVVSDSLRIKNFQN